MTDPMFRQRRPEPFTAEYNDTLGGLLYEFERPEEKHLRGSLGYWQMVEERMIRDQLLAEGWSGKYIYSEISKRVIANHKDDATFREICEVRSSRAGPPRPDTRFTVEEFERLSEHFAGANDPVAQSILAKALAGIGNG